MQATAMWVMAAQGSVSLPMTYPLTDHLLRGGHDAPKKG